jgi:hypothetical protein
LPDAILKELQDIGRHRGRLNAFRFTVKRINRAGNVTARRGDDIPAVRASINALKLPSEVAELLLAGAEISVRTSPCLHDWEPAGIKFDVSTFNRSRAFFPVDVQNDEAAANLTSDDADICAWVLREDVSRFIFRHSLVLKALPAFPDGMLAG